MRPASPSAAEKALPLRRDADVAVAQSIALRLAREAGFSKQAGWEFAIAVSEAATNILKYAVEGEVILRARECCLEFEALDRGSGIDDVETMLCDGYSENRNLAAAQVTINRRGLGLGLGAIQRLTDELSIAPRSGGGTVLVARKYRPGMRGRKNGGGEPSHELKAQEKAGPGPPHSRAR